jgi:hypothetical protein
MKLTPNEVRVLQAIDASEYGDNLLDSVWSFTIADHSDLAPRSIGGIVSSLSKKGITKSSGYGNEETIRLTPYGVGVYYATVGIKNAKKKA